MQAIRVHGKWEPNTYWVLELDFGGLNVAAESFDLNQVINEALRKFVHTEYNILETIGKK